MYHLAIEPKSEGKGRTFRSTLLASVEADLLWPGGLSESDNQRPVWAMFAGSENELKAFMANLTTGRYASYGKKNNYSRDKEPRLEVLKSAGFRTVWQKEEEGVVATIFLPDLFMMDPGMVDPAGAKFVLLPTQQWLSEQEISKKPLKEHIQKCGYEIPLDLKYLAPVSYLFAAYLDRRTRCPLVSDGRFFLQIMLSCLNQGLASFASDPDRREWYSREDKPFGVHPHKRYHEKGLNNVGLLPGVVFSASHDEIERVLSEEVQTYFSHL